MNTSEVVVDIKLGDVVGGLHGGYIQTRKCTACEAVDHDVMLASRSLIKNRLGARSRVKLAVLQLWSAVHGLMRARSLDRDRWQIHVIVGSADR